MATLTPTQIAAIQADLTAIVQSLTTLLTYLSTTTAPAPAPAPAPSPPPTAVPTYVGGVMPGFFNTSATNGQSLVIDLGHPLNSPTTFTVVLSDNGVPVFTSTITPVLTNGFLTFTWPITGLKSGDILSALLTPINALGAGPTLAVPGILIN